MTLVTFGEDRIFSSENKVWGTAHRVEKKSKILRRSQQIIPRRRKIRKLFKKCGIPKDDGYDF